MITPTIIEPTIWPTIIDTITATPGADVQNWIWNDGGDIIWEDDGGVILLGD